MKQIKLEQIINYLLSEMFNLKFSESTIKSYKYKAFFRIKKFFDENGQIFYSKELINIFLMAEKERLNSHKISERNYSLLRKATELLEEYYTKGTMKWRTRRKHSKIVLNKYFTSILCDYEENLSIQFYDMNYLKSYVIQFLKYIEDKGYKNLKSMPISVLSDFILHTSPNHKGSMNNVIFSIRKFFHYLNENAISELNADKVLQKVSRQRKKVLPYFSHKEVETILAQIDICTAEGKRDYAIIFLASRTGLRSVDIINLKLTDIDWRKNEMYIIQRKTTRPLILPLEANVGKAIADYILLGRPSTDSQYIFIRSVAPYTKLADRGTGKHIIKKYLDKTEISHLPGEGKGFHALRRSISTWMLEAGVPLPTISQVLGHHNQDSTKQYISLHYSLLVECTLGLNEIRTKKEELI